MGKKIRIIGQGLLLTYPGNFCCSLLIDSKVLPHHIWMAIFLAMQLSHANLNVVIHLWAKCQRIYCHWVLDPEQKRHPFG